MVRTSSVVPRLQNLFSLSIFVLVWKRLPEQEKKSKTMPPVSKHYRSSWVGIGAARCFVCVVVKSAPRIRSTTKS